MLSRVILAVDTPAHHRKLISLLQQLDVIVDSVKRRDLLWERISRESGDLIVVSQSLIPPPVVQTIGLLRELPDSPGVIVLSERKEEVVEVDLLAAGCEAVIHPGLSSHKLKDLLAAVIARRGELALRRFAAARMLAEPRLSDFVSQSPAMQAFMTVVHRVVSSTVPLLFLGETGVGKERLARAIHAESPRSTGPFVAVNCGALPEALLESELFGHEEGAFTGATRSRRGWFELAHLGTVFLDEIADLPYHLQVKLLRVLQEHDIQRVGSERSIKVDVRVMAATNRALEKAVEEKQFRQDLYYRLSVVTLTVPPLRERKDDIPDLIKSYIDYFRTGIKCGVTGITAEALEALIAYPWPGNVRELMNVIERAMLLCNGAEITPNDLPATISGGPVGTQHVVWSLANPDNGDAVPDAWLQKPLGEVRRVVLDAFERSYLAGLLDSTRGKIGETARRAGIQPRSLFEKMRKHGLRKEDFKPQRADR